MTAGAAGATGAAGAAASTGRPWRLALLAALLLAAAAGLAALGAWQLERRAWKRDLIQRVETRLREAPVAAPGPALWPSLTAEGDAYRRVRLAGRFRHDRETLVTAVTDLGGGSWVLTPLDTDAGFTVLVNRGFVPPERRDPARRPPPSDGPVQVTGLLRTSEPGGGFLRPNDPAADRWHSRDVAAIAAARGLGDVAPYFVDADAASSPGVPAGGLTRVAFHDRHLVYALTWLALAAMALAAALRVGRDAWRERGPTLRTGRAAAAGGGGTGRRGSS